MSANKKSANRSRDVNPSQSTFHTFTSDLQSYSAAMLEELFCYKECLEKLFEAGTQLSGTFRDIFKGTSVSPIGDQFLEISASLASAVSGYSQSLTTEITIDTQRILGNCGKDERNEHDVQVMCNVFLKMVQMQTQIFLTSTDVLSQLSESGDVQELREKFSTPEKVQTLRENSKQSLEGLKLLPVNQSTRGSQTHSPDVGIKQKLAKASNFFNKLGGKATPPPTSEIPKSLFYVQTPMMPGDCLQPIVSSTQTLVSLNQTANEIVSQCVETDFNSALPGGPFERSSPVKATHIASQEEIDCVIGLLSGYQRHPPPMQTIPEIPTPGPLPKYPHSDVQIAHAGLTISTPIGTTQTAFASLGTTQTTFTSGGIPQVNIQAPTPPAQSQAFEMQFPPRPGLVHRYSDGMTPVIEKPSSNTWPHPSRAGSTESIEAQLSSLYGLPINAQTELEFTRYLASIGALTDDLWVDNSNLNRSWPRRKDPNASWPPPACLEETSSEDSSDGEQLINLGLDLSSGYKDQRRHSTEEQKPSPLVVIGQERSANQKQTCSRSAEDLTHSYKTSRTWPPKQTWNRPISTGQVSSLATNELFQNTNNVRQYPNMQWDRQQQPAVNTSWVQNQGQSLPPVFSHGNQGFLFRRPPDGVRDQAPM